MTSWFENKNENYRYKEDKKEIKEVEEPKKSFFKKALTPKNTEELRPGLFINKIGDNYRRVYPLIWNDKFNWKNQIRLKNIFMILIIVFIAWSYVHNVKVYQEFYGKIINNTDGYTQSFCSNFSYSLLVTNEGKSNIPDNSGLGS